MPERGRGHDKPYPIAQLSINAQPLRFLDFLVQNSIFLNVNNLRIRLPHPAAYALHKFIIFERRRKKDKKDRDIEGALRVFHEMIRENQHLQIHKIFKKMHKKWQKKVLDNLKLIDELDIIDILTNK